MATPWGVGNFSPFGRAPCVACRWVSRFLMGDLSLLWTMRVKHCMWTSCWTSFRIHVDADVKHLSWTSQLVLTCLGVILKIWTAHKRPPLLSFPGNQRVQKCSRRAIECNTSVLSSTIMTHDYESEVTSIALASLSSIVRPILSFSLYNFGPLCDILWLTYEQSISFLRSPGRWTRISLHWIQHSVIPCCDVGQPGQKARRTIGTCVIKIWRSCMNLLCIPLPLSLPAFQREVVRNVWRSAAGTSWRQRSGCDHSTIENPFRTASSTDWYMTCSYHRETKKKFDKST